MKKPLAGFTVVELAVVIVVIGILAAITKVSYRNVQNGARDSAIKDSTEQVADALQLWATRNNTTPNNTTSAGATNGQGWVQTGKYTKTIEDVLVEAGYLTPGFSSKLVSASAMDGSNSNILMFYACTNGRYAVYAALNDASQKTAQQTKASSAGCTTTPFTSYSMNYVILF